MSALREVNTISKQLRGFVQCDVGGFWQQTDSDNFGFAARVENPNGIRPAEAVFRPFDAHDRTTELLNVTDRALVLFGQYRSPEIPGSCSLEFCFTGRHIRQQAYHAQLSYQATTLKIPTNVAQCQPLPRWPILMKLTTVTPWLTSREAASYLKVDHRTLLAWARQGKVTGYVLSGVQRRVWRFRQVDLDATMELPAVLTAEAE